MEYNDWHNMSANPLILTLLSLLASVGCGKLGPRAVQALPSATNLPAPVLAPSETPVILFYQDTLGLDIHGPQDQLDVAVWSDGRVVWYAEGALVQARIDTKKIDELLQRLHQEGVFGDGKSEYSSFGPDSGFDVVDVRLADRRLRLRSWHEAFEQDPRLVVTSSGGVESLDGRDRSAVLAAEPKEYLRFRRLWSDIRSTVKSWLPSKGEPFHGTVPVGRGD